MRQNIEINIQELVLHGFEPGQRFRVSEAVKVELTHLLHEKGLNTSLVNEGQFSHIDCGSFMIGSSFGPDKTGAQIARTVLRGLSR